MDERHHRPVHVQECQLRARQPVREATVLAGVTFTTSLVATVLAVPLWSRLVRSLGVYLFPTTPGVLLRAEVGTAAMLAVTAVFAMGVGTILRRSATAVTTVIAATVLPYLLALTRSCRHPWHSG
jgi:hypothetical protein